MGTNLKVNEEVDMKTGVHYFSVSGTAGKHQFFRLGRLETTIQATAYSESLKEYDPDFVPLPPLLKKGKHNG
jgi:hypothetical protein